MAKTSNVPEAIIVGLHTVAIPYNYVGHYVSLTSNDKVPDYEFIPLLAPITTGVIAKQNDWNCICRHPISFSFTFMYCSKLLPLLYNSQKGV